jgi:spermidine synthase
MDGLHILLNLYHCREGGLFQRDSTALRAFCLETIKRGGLTALTDRFHQFEGGGVTGCVVLAESHLAIHTWPELGSVTLDVYVCNYTHDNSNKARQIVNDFMRLFHPRDKQSHEISRGKPIPECLSPR